MRRFINSVKEDGQMQETIKDFKESMNFEEQQKEISNLNQELKTGMDFGDDVKIEDFQRPSFGGEQPAMETESGGQFNRAPAQPNAQEPIDLATTEKLSATESEASKPIETPPEVADISTDVANSESSPSSETNKS
jgi:sec-independent protein translocase protein TatB